MAQDAVDKVIEMRDDLQASAGPCITLHTPLTGADGYHRGLTRQLIQDHRVSKTVSDHLVATYGVNAMKVLELGDLMRETSVSNDNPRWHGSHKRLHPDFPYLDVEVTYAMLHEYAVTAVDIIGQRTRLAFLDVDAARKTVPRVVELMARTGGWDEARRECEEAAAYEFLDTFGGPVPKDDHTRTIATIEEAFRTMDKDNSGLLSHEEVLAMAQSLGLGVETASSVEKSIMHMDSDGDGEVSLEEFTAWWLSDETESLFKKELFSRYAATTGKLSKSTGVAFG